MSSTVRVEPADGVTIIVAHPGAPETSEARSTVLVDSLFQVVEGLTASVRSQDRRTVVDVRVGENLSASSRANVGAFIAAVKGLVQSLTLEIASDGPTVNVIVSRESQAAARGRTTEYVLSDDGGYSLGATYDLRGERS